MSLGVHPHEIVEGSESPLLAKDPSWDRVEVGEVAEVLNGYAFKSGYFNKNGEGLPLLRIRDVGRDGTDAHYSGPFEDRYLVYPGDFLIGMDGDFRIAEWRGEMALLNQRVCKLTVKDRDRYEPRFLLHLLQGYLDAIHEVTSAVTVKHLSSKTVVQIPVPDPPIDEQRRIVEAIETHLSHLDAGVDSLERAERNVERMRKSVFRAAVSSELVPTRGETKAAVLGDVCDVVSGNTPKGITTVEGGSIPFFKVGDMNMATGRYMGGSRIYQDNSSVEALKLKIRPAGTVIFPKRGGAILTNKKRVLVVPSTFDLNTMGVIPGDTMHPTYLWLWFESLDLAAFSDGSNVPQINHGDIKPLTIPLPPMPEQVLIVNEAERQLSLIDDVGATVRDSTKRVGGLRRSVLAAAFSGELA